jgi:hypothetical protein
LTVWHSMGKTTIPFSGVFHPVLQDPLDKIPTLKKLAFKEW